jgi:hypothetical protein
MRASIYIRWLPVDVIAQLHATYDRYHSDGRLAYEPYWIREKTWSDGSITYTPQ